MPPAAEDKRKRRSLEDTAGKRKAADDDWEEGEPQESDGEGRPPARKTPKKARGKGKAQAMDEDLRAEEEAEEEEDAAMSQEFDGTQRVAAPTAALAADSLAGLIDSVEMWNFMTYTHQKVTLGPNINFIYGRNGSGKSSVLSAIIVCFGGKSSATDRGSSIKGLVKTGTTNAKVAVTIYNRGPEAYRPETYGDKIIVERYLSTTAAGSYKILNAKRVVQEQRKEEVVRIADHFNIQVENPLCILTQEMSKSFIRTSSEEEKYKFFLIGTQLDRMQADYKECNEERLVVAEILKKKEASMPLLEEEVKEVERRYEECTRLHKMEEDLERLKNEMVWADINEQERAVETVDHKIEVAKEELPKVSAKVEEKISALQEREGEITSITTELKDAETEISRLTSDQEALVRAAKAKRKEVATLQNEVKTSKSQERDLEAERASLVATIEKLKAANNKQKGAEQQRLASEIQKLEHDLQNFRKESKAVSGYMTELEQRINTVNEGSFQRSRELTGAQQAIQSIKNRIKHLQGSKQNRLRVFGEFMPTIVTEIEKENRWHQKPIAPIGAHIQLKDKVWAVAIEKTIGFILSSIAVNDEHDYQLMRAIFKRVVGNEERFPQCIMLRIQNHMYSDFQGECARVSGCPTVFDVISVSHPHVANCLIDQAKIHQTVLFKRPDQARQIVFQSKVDWLSTGYTVEGDQLKPDGRWYSNKDRNQSSRLSEDFDDQIRVAESELQSKVREADLMSASASQSGSELESLKQEQGKERAKLKSLHTTLHHLEKTIRDKRAAVQEDEEIDTREHEDRVVEIESQIEEARARAAKYTALVEAARSQVDPEMRQISESNNAVEKYKNNIEALSEKLATATTARDMVRATLDKHQRRRSELERELHELGVHSRTSHESIDAQRRKAEEKGFTYVKTNKKPADLDLKIAAMSKRLQKEQGTRGNVDDVARELKQKREMYQSAVVTLKSLQKFVDMMENAVGQRVQCFKNFRRYMAARVHMYFMTLLRQKRFEGKIKFDHENQKLDLEVNVDTTRTKSDGREVKTSALSGGERSFSTICMLMALWEAMDAPFYCMDEFDVCMDSVTRRISLGMLLDTAQQKKDHQYVLLTPNSIENVTKDGVDVRFHRLMKEAEVPANQPTIDGYVGAGAAN